MPPPPPRMRNVPTYERRGDEETRRRESRIDIIAADILDTKYSELRESRAASRETLLISS